MFNPDYFVKNLAPSTFSELVKDVMTNPLDISYQKILHDYCLDEGFNYLEYTKKRLKKFNCINNGYCITGLVLTNISNFYSELDFIVRFCPIITIGIGVMPCCYPDLASYLYPCSFHSRSQKGYVIPQVIYQYLKYKIDTIQSPVTCEEAISDLRETCTRFFVQRLHWTFNETDKIEFPRT